MRCTGILEPLSPMCPYRNRDQDSTITREVRCVSSFATSEKHNFPRIGSETNPVSWHGPSRLHGDLDAGFGDTESPGKAALGFSNGQRLIAIVD